MRRALSPLALLVLGGGLALAAGAKAQEFAIPEVTYPDLPAQAAEPEGFVPPGWALEAKVEGDLDRDGLADLALVVRQQEPKNVLPNDGLGEKPFNTNPRILAVALRDTSGGYRLALANRTLIPRRADPIQEDPFADRAIEIERGGLRVHLRHFMSAGGWDMWAVHHHFRFRKGRFELIGYDRVIVTRNTGETKDISVNFLTGKIKLSTGNISEDNPRTVSWKTLRRRDPLTIDSIGDGLGFDPER